MDRVEELIEWVANTLMPYAKQLEEEFGSGNMDNVFKLSRELAKQILSHPDLALIDRERTPPVTFPEKLDADYIKAWEQGANDLTRGGWLPVIPLAEAIKEK